MKGESNESNQDALQKLEGKSQGTQPPVQEGYASQEGVPTKPSKLPHDPTIDAEETVRRVMAAPVLYQGASSGEGVVDPPLQEPPAPRFVQAETVPEKAQEPSAPVSQPVAPAEPAVPSFDPRVTLSDRIAPPVTIQPQTETTVTGPTSPTEPGKDKDGSKVSSWLKSKLHRRTSKATPTSPESKPTISAPKDPKVFIGAANLGAPDSSTTASSEPADDSVREVAMAGKEAGPVDAPVVSPTSELQEEDVARTTTAAAAGAPHEASDGDESSSISSLSSDEDTRGRSALRLADQLEQSGPLPVSGEQKVAADNRATDSKDFGAAQKAQRESSDGGRAEEFEEAKDQFDSEGLEPPQKGILGSSTGDGRKSDSPVRDSKFVENL